MKSLVGLRNDLCVHCIYICKINRRHRKRVPILLIPRLLIKLSRQSRLWTSISYPWIWVECPDIHEIDVCNLLNLEQPCLKKMASTLLLADAINKEQQGGTKPRKLKLHFEERRDHEEAILPCALLVPDGPCRSCYGLCHVHHLGTSR